MQGLANQAQAAAQRRAQVTALRIAQANRQAIQPQYLQEISQPAQISSGPLLSQGLEPLQSQQQQQKQPEEDYDVSFYITYDYFAIRFTKSFLKLKFYENVSSFEFEKV